MEMHLNNLDTNSRVLDLKGFSVGNTFLCLLKFLIFRNWVLVHTSLEVLVGQKKELWIPPIWGCWGPTGDSFFIHEQIKHPAFFEGRWYTGKIICQIWAEWAVCLDSYLWKGWMFYLSIGKKPPVDPQRPQIGGIKSSFFFGRLALPMMCGIPTYLDKRA